jgi:hypothetical protein
MGLEARFNRWLVGAVMGKKFVKEHKHLAGELYQEEKKIVGSTKKEIASLRDFLQ